MNKRALLYAGFLTAAVAVLLASGRFRKAPADSGTEATVATNR